MRAMSSFRRRHRRQKGVDQVGDANDAVGGEYQ
jgi:hypothetical protein